MFYENRPNGKALRVIKNVKPPLMIIFLVLFLSFVGISRIQGYKDPCPANADCGVFINCHPGFSLNSKNEC